MGGGGRQLATYRGTCDASAGVLDANRLLVATDEDNVLRCYVLGEEEPVAAFDRFMERHRVVKRLALAYLVFGVARMVAVLAFRFDLIHKSPLARFASRLFG